MILRSCIVLTALVASIGAGAGPGAPAGCGPPSAAESLAARGMVGARGPVLPITQAALRARADTFARYAAWRPETRPDSAALALAFQAQVYLALGRPDTAVAPAHAALALARTARGQPSEATARATLGEVLQSRGHADSALAQYDSALAIITRPDQVRERGRVCNDIGIAYHDMGALDKARDYLTATLALREALADSEGIAVSVNNIGRLQQTLGRPDASLAWFQRSLAVRRALGDSAGVALVMANVGYAHDLMGDPEGALAAYRVALAALASVDNPGAEGLTLINLARAHLALGHAAVARDDVTVGMALERRTGNAAALSWAWHDLGRADIALGNVGTGLAWLDSARVSMHALGDRSREGSALYNIGLARQHLGGEDDLRAAVAAYGEAMRVRLAVGRTAGNDADRVAFAEQDANLTSKRVLAWLALAPYVGADSVARASLAAAEDGRARALLDLLQSRAGAASAPPAVTRRRTAPTLSYLVTPGALVTWLTLPDGRVSSTCQRIARQEIDSLVSRLRAHIWADRVGGQHVIAHVSTMLADPYDDAPAGCTAEAPRGDDTLGRDAALSALGRLVLPASLLALLPASGALVIVPHAQLALVPFAALPVAGTSTALGLRYAVRYAPSFALLDAVDGLPRQAVTGTSALIVGDPAMPADPDGGGVFDSLPGARATAEWLATTVGGTRALTGRAATVGAVTAGLPAATLVHLGTHGRAYDTESRARDSFVVLAGVDSTALLRVRDVLALPPLHAELVVLMACETGLGDLTESEGTSGLQRAFLARGARAVLVSLWSVDRDASDMLIRAFYRSWLSGGDKGEALRRAQAEVLAWRRSRKLDTNPYYWAGFQVVGAT